MKQDLAFGRRLQRLVMIVTDCAPHVQRQLFRNSDGKPAVRGCVAKGALTGYVPLADIGAEFLFQVIAERTERATLTITTNLPFGPFSEWRQVFPNPRLCKALLDRITDRAHIIETGTDSYRFWRTLEAPKKKKAS